MWETWARNTFNRMFAGMQKHVFVRSIKLVTWTEVSFLMHKNAILLYRDSQN